MAAETTSATVGANDRPDYVFYGIGRDTPDHARARYEARLADGRLEIWSQPGSGTTVRATIPQRMGEPRPAAPSPPEVPSIPTASSVSG